jgi:hypothetical protein
MRLSIQNKRIGFVRLDGDGVTPVEQDIRDDTSEAEVSF